MKTNTVQDDPFKFYKRSIIDRFVYILCWLFVIFSLIVISAGIQVLFKGDDWKRGLSFTLIGLGTIALIIFIARTFFSSGNLFHLGNYFYRFSRQRGLRLSINAFSRAIKKNPTMTAAYINRAVCYMDKYEKEPAWKDLQVAVSQEPNWSRIHFAIGLYLDHFGDRNESHKYYEKALTLSEAAIEEAKNKKTGGMRDAFRFQHSFDIAHARPQLVKERLALCKGRKGGPN